MQNVLPIVRGERPWQPQPAVLTGQVLDRHGHPRVGLLHHDNRVVLYRQLEGPGAERVWAYVTVRPAEVWALQDALGPVAFNRVLERLYRNRNVTLALAPDLRITKIRTQRNGSAIEATARSLQGNRFQLRGRRTKASAAPVGAPSDVQVV